MASNATTRNAYRLLIEFTAESDAAAQERAVGFDLPPDVRRTGLKRQYTTFSEIGLGDAAPAQPEVVAEPASDGDETPSEGAEPKAEQPAGNGRRTRVSA